MRSLIDAAHVLAVFVSLACLPAAAPADLPPKLREAVQQRIASEELRNLQRWVPSMRIVSLPGGPGEVSLKPDDSLTIEHLRGVELDSDPPALGRRTVQYDPRQADDCPADRRPYVARGIAPFRFRYFHCEFNFGGWHNFDMQDYAVTRGFDTIYPYTRKVEEVQHWPQGTKTLHWSGFVDWHKWLPEHGIEEGRYDQLVGMDDLVKMHLEEGSFKRDPQSADAKHRADLLMIDQEHPVLSPEKLREQPWYPKDGIEPERLAFEKRYYDGYAQTYLSSVSAARQSGWKNISIYGWYPYGRTWGGLEKVEAEPGTNQAWNAFGKQILDAVDLVNNSVYCFYWSPQNVAYTLANVDMNLAMVNSASRPKPVRPYYWILLHGGGGGWRWWREQPIANEEKRAMIAMGFFTGFDGFDSWCWSGTGSLHAVSLGSKVKKTIEEDGQKKQVIEWQGHEVMVGREFTANDEQRKPESFHRYDVLRVASVDDAAETVRFQKIRPGTKDNGVGVGRPYFAMSREELLRHLRPKSEAVAGMIEGMALVKPLEFLLRHGEVKIDVPAQQQFGKTLPVVRRVKYGSWHVLATYDPKVIYGGKPREIVLEDFDGVSGRTLRLPADAQMRIFVLQE